MAKSDNDQPNQTNITVTQVQGGVLVTLLHTQAALDADSYLELIAAAEEGYEVGLSNLIFDMSNVPSMSSSGLVTLHNIAILPNHGAGREAFYTTTPDLEAGLQEQFKLLSPQPQVEQALEQTGFKTLPELLTDLETAIMMSEEEIQMNNKKVTSYGTFTPCP